MESRQPLAQQALLFAKLKTLLPASWRPVNHDYAQGSDKFCIKRKPVLDLEPTNLPRSCAQLSEEPAELVCTKIAQCLADSRCSINRLSSPSPPPPEEPDMQNMLKIEVIKPSLVRLLVTALMTLSGEGAGEMEVPRHSSLDQLADSGEAVLPC